MNLQNMTFAIGLSWLIWGALFFEYPDWDIGLSVLMASSTYLTADRVIMSIKQRQYAMWPISAIAAWWCVDGSYWLYWSLVRPEVMIREGQWLMSLCLYLLCGIIWSVGTLIEHNFDRHQFRKNLAQPAPKTG